jgi:hypothetical protein
MVALVYTDLFGGSIYAVAAFADGTHLHFYNGVIIADWVDGIVLVNDVTLTGVAAKLAALIDASPNYSATSAGPVVTVTAQPAANPYTVLTQVINGGVVDDQAITYAQTVANVTGVTGTAAACGFQITAGDAVATITSLKIGGTEILGGTITWAVSNTATATATATQINTNTGSTGWGAVAVGQTVNITNVATGTVNNDLTFTGTWTGNLKINGVAAGAGVTIQQTSGGLNAVTAVAQVGTLTLTGTFEAGDAFGVRLTSGAVTLTSEYFGNYAKPYGLASVVKTHKRKMYVGLGPLIDFCQVNDATGWNFDLDPGAGFINGSTHVGGSESANALATYQGRLAVFSRRAIQLWTMQNDDTLNNLDQVIENTGTRSPHSVLEYGGNDTFYLDDTGIRSLRARDASNNAYLTDVGVAIDRLVREWMRTGASEADIANARAVVDPVDGRFWIAIGTRIYVYSYFPTSKVAAWTWYEPGFTPSAMVRTKTQVYIRANNTLYLYGGVSGEEYDASQVTIQLPFFDSRKPGTFKGYSGMDMAATSEWSVIWYVDPSPEVNGSKPGMPGITGPFVDLGKDSGVTYSGSEWNAGGHFTHVAPRFIQSLPEYASLSQVALYYEGREERN